MRLERLLEICLISFKSGRIYLFFPINNDFEFKHLPELRTLEENLQAPVFNRKGIHAIAENLKISGLEQFLERMV